MSACCFVASLRSLSLSLSLSLSCRSFRVEARFPDRGNEPRRDERSACVTGIALVGENGSWKFLENACTERFARARIPEYRDHWKRGERVSIRSDRGIASRIHVRVATPARKFEASFAFDKTFILDAFPAGRLKWQLPARNTFELS